VVLARAATGSAAGPSCIECREGGGQAMLPAVLGVCMPVVPGSESVTGGRTRPPLATPHVAVHDLAELERITTAGWFRRCHDGPG
jgi:hypothetical protein